MALSSGGPKGQPLFCWFEGPLRGRTREDHQLLDLLDPVAEASGYAIVRLRLMGGAGKARRLQIMAEDASGEMTVDDCARLSRAISDVLEAADPVEGDYVLEVSSPGIDRPLTRLKDFSTYAGYDVRLELDRLADGRKRFKGGVVGVEDGCVALNAEGEADTVLIPFEWIAEAKLVLTDELMKRGAAARAARLDHERAPEGADEE
jgi:ribosome maturation factor RimP